MEHTRNPARSRARVLRSKSWISIKYPPVVQITSLEESADKRHRISPMENWDVEDNVHNNDNARFTWSVENFLIS